MGNRFERQTRVHRRENDFFDSHYDMTKETYGQVRIF
jgi:hypothetical protein